MIECLTSAGSRWPGRERTCKAVHLIPGKVRTVSSSVPGGKRDQHHAASVCQVAAEPTGHPHRERRSRSAQFRRQQVSRPRRGRRRAATRSTRSRRQEQPACEHDRPAVAAAEHADHARARSSRSTSRRARQRAGARTFRACRCAGAIQGSAAGRLQVQVNQQGPGNSVGSYSPTTPQPKGTTITVNVGLFSRPLASSRPRSGRDAAAGPERGPRSPGLRRAVPDRSSAARATGRRCCGSRAPPRSRAGPRPCTPSRGPT